MAAAIAADVTDRGVDGDVGVCSETVGIRAEAAGPRTRDLTSSMTLSGALCDDKNVKNNGLGFRRNEWRSTMLPSDCRKYNSAMLSL